MREASISNLEMLRGRGRPAAGRPAALPGIATDRPTAGQVTGQVGDRAGDDVGNHVQTALARVPSWFTVAQARRVAQLKGVGHVLTEDHGRVSGSASLATLAAAPATDALARWTSRTDTAVSPTTSVTEAERLMRAAGVSCLPVVAGGLLVGTVALVDLRHPHQHGRDGDHDGDQDFSHAA